jgi:hypothetical protein
MPQMKMGRGAARCGGAAMVGRRREGCRVVALGIQEAREREAQTRAIGRRGRRAQGIAQARQQRCARGSGPEKLCVAGQHLRILGLKRQQPLVGRLRRGALAEIFLQGRKIRECRQVMRV